MVIGLLCWLLLANADYCKADSDDDIGSIVGSSNSDMSWRSHDFDGSSQANKCTRKTTIITNVMEVFSVIMVEVVSKLVMWL